MAEIKWVRNGPEAVLAAAAPSSPGLIRDLERRGEIQRSRGATRHCDQQSTTEAPVELHGPMGARSGSGSVSGRGRPAWITGIVSCSRKGSCPVYDSLRYRTALGGMWPLNDATGVRATQCQDGVQEGSQFVFVYRVEPQ